VPASPSAACSRPAAKGGACVGGRPSAFQECLSPASAPSPRDLSVRDRVSPLMDPLHSFRQQLLLPASRRYFVTTRTAFRRKVVVNTRSFVTVASKALCVSISVPQDLPRWASCSANLALTRAYGAFDAIFCFRLVNSADSRRSHLYSRHRTAMVRLDVPPGSTSPRRRILRRSVTTLSASWVDTDADTIAFAVSAALPTPLSAG